MELKKVNITKSTKVTADGYDITREQIIKLSEDWSDTHISIFKKVVRQGGRVTIKNIDFICTPLGKITNSQNQKDGGAPKMYGPES
jgi:hypothetical protein